MRAERFPLGAGVTVAGLEGDPHDLLARLRAREPVSWLPAVDGWLVTRRDLALAAMRDAATFTVDDPRFTTAQVVGESMLSLDGAEHARHRAPFVAPLRLGEVRRRLADAVEDGGGRGWSTSSRRAARASCGAASPGRWRPRRSRTRSGSTAPRPARCSAGTTRSSPPSPTSARGGRRGEEAARAVEQLGEAVELDAAGLTDAEVKSNVAVLLFGGIETTEGMIANARPAPAVGAGGAGRRARRPGAAARRGRGVAAARARRRGDRPLRDARRRARRRGDRGRRARADLDHRRQPRPGDVRRPRPLRPRARRTPAATSRSPAARTCAWACTSRGSRRTSRSPRCSSGCPGCGSTRRPAAIRGLMFRKPPELRVRWST